MAPSGHAYGNLTALGTRPVSAAAGERGTGPGYRIPFYGALVFAGIRVLGLAVAAFLLPRGKFRELHYSLPHLVSSWDSGRYLIIAVHGYSYVPGDTRHDSVFAWFPGYPAAVHAVAWIPGVGVVWAGLAVTIAAGMAAAGGLAKLGMTLTIGWSAGSRADLGLSPPVVQAVAAMGGSARQARDLAQHGAGEFSADLLAIAGG